MFYVERVPYVLVFLLSESEVISTKYINTTSICVNVLDGQIAAEDMNLDSHQDKAVHSFIENDTVLIPPSLLMSLQKQHSSRDQVILPSFSSHNTLPGLFYKSLASAASHFVPNSNLNQISESSANPRILHRLPTLPSSWYCNNAITLDEERAALALIQLCPSSKWISLSARKLQVYGGHVSSSGLVRKAEPKEHHSSIIDISTTDRLPIWLQDVISRVHSLGICYPDYIPGVPFAYSSSSTTIHDFVGKERNGENDENGENILSHAANHILLNRYFPGQGIMPHLDGTSYSPLVVILSLGAPLLIHFWRAQGTERESPDNAVCAIYLEPRSLFVFADELYTGLRHGIAEVTADVVRWKHTHLSEGKNMNGLSGMCCNVPFLSSEMRKYLDANSSEANHADERICIIPRLVPRYSLTIRYVKPVEECGGQILAEEKECEG